MPCIGYKTTVIDTRTQQATQANLPVPVYEIGDLLSAPPLRLPLALDAQ